MKSLICQFCSQPLSREKEASIYYHFKCPSCQAAFVYSQDENIMFYTLKTNIDNSSFVLNFYPTVKQFTASKSGFGSLLKLDYIPDITPSNINTKIQTLLLFKNN